MSSSQVLTCHLVVSLTDVLEIRRLRNSCCEFLTNHQEPIGVLQQIRWYLTYYCSAQRSSIYRLYLFRNLERLPVAYGALLKKNNQLLVTECVASEFRGKGFGKVILEHLIAVAQREQCELVAEIWAYNARSVSLHEHAGFVLNSSCIKWDKELRTYRLKA